MGALQTVKCNLYAAPKWLGVSLLRKCSQLLVLIVDGGFFDYSTATTIATCCVKLQKLKINFWTHNMVHWLQVIAATCTQIRHLEIGICDWRAGARLGNVLPGMPNLHTLSCMHFTKGDLVALVVRAPPSLLALNTGERYTSVDDVRTMTAAQPQLTTLCLLVSMRLAEDTHVHHVLEHCTALQCLILRGTEESVASVMAILESAVIYCPQLTTICIKGRLSCISVLLLMSVIGQFSNLHKLSLPNSPQASAIIAVPQSNPGLIITSEEVPFPDWVPSA